MQADAAGADDADDGRRAGVGFEVVEHLARDHREAPAGSGRSGARAGSLPPVETTPSIGLRSAFSIASENSLPNAPKSRRSDGEHAGERAEPDDVDQDQRPDQHVDAADRVERRGATAKCTKMFGDHVLGGEECRPGTPARAAASVPRNAIASVSPSALRTVMSCGPGDRAATSARRCCRAGRARSRCARRRIPAARTPKPASADQRDDVATMRARRAGSSRNTAGWRAAQRARARTALMPRSGAAHRPLLHADQTRGAAAR